MVVRQKERHKRQQLAARRENPDCAPPSVCRGRKCFTAHHRYDLPIRRAGKRKVCLRKILRRSLLGKNCFENFHVMASNSTTETSIANGHSEDDGELPCRHPVVGFIKNSGDSYKCICANLLLFRSFIFQPASFLHNSIRVMAILSANEFGFFSRLPMWSSQRYY